VAGEGPAAFVAVAVVSAADHRQVGQVGGGEPWPLRRARPPHRHTNAP